MKTPSFTFLRVAILLGMLSALGGVALLFWSQTYLNDSIRIQGTIVESINRISIDLTDSNGDLINISNQVDILKSKNKELDNFLNSMKTFLMIGQSLSIAGILMLFISFMITFSTHNQVKAALKNNFEQGKVKGNQDFARILDKNPSVLLNMLNWIYLSQKGKSNPETALRIFEQFFIRAQEKMGLQPYGLIGEILKFDHQRHDNQSAGVKQGDKVRVIETGWTMGNTIIRKPMVEKE